LLEAAESVLPQLTATTELLIIDNGSTDGTAGVARGLEERDSRVRYESEEQPGIACARNAALAKGLGSYVLFLDDDELAAPGWVDHYLRFLERNTAGRIASVGGPYIASHRGRTPVWVRPSFGVFDLGRKEGPLPPGQALAGGNSAYHRQRALEIGGFSERRSRSDDSEINLRLQNAGWEVWWLPRAAVYHVISAERFRVRYQLKVAFAEGKDRALLSAATFAPRGRYPIYAFARTVLAPAHFLVLLVASLVQLCRGKIAFGVESLVKISRYLGMIREWLRPRHWRTWASGSARLQPIPSRSASAR
jgi:glycosyltransferase involved in cell wall biosynthesis